MCLVINADEHPNLKTKVADKDIVCYKVLSKDKNGDYCSLCYNRKKWIVGKEYSNHGKQGVYFNNVHEGFYHSYMNKKDAEKHVHELPYRCGHVAECIIPKGTRYYFGWFREGNTFNYASRKLKVVNVI